MRIYAKIGRAREAEAVAPATPRVERVCRGGAARPSEVLGLYRRWAESAMQRAAELERLSRTSELAAHSFAGTMTGSGATDIGRSPRRGMLCPARSLKICRRSAGSLRATRGECTASGKTRAPMSSWATCRSETGHMRMALRRDASACGGDTGQRSRPRRSAVGVVGNSAPGRQRDAGSSGGACACGR